MLHCEQCGDDLIAEVWCGFFCSLDCFEWRVYDFRTHDPDDPDREKDYTEKYPA